MNVLSWLLWVRNPNPRLSWMLLARCLSKPVVRTCCLGLQSQLKAQWKRILFQAYPSHCWQVLTGQRHESPVLWLPCPYGLLMTWSASPDWELQGGERAKRTAKTSSVFLDPSLLLDGTSCHSCCMLWLGVRHEVWSTLMGRGFHKGMTPMEGIIGKQEVGWGKDAHILQGSLSQAS